MTAKEKKVVYAVFSSLLEKDYRELNKFLGSETISEMKKLHHRLKYEDFCKARGIKVSEMTEDDYESYELAKAWEREREAQYADEDSL